MALTVRQIEHALRRTSGNVTAAARELGCSRAALYKRIARSPFLQQVLADAREELVDIAEAELLRKIKAGNIAAIIFALKTLGKARGYVERQEFSGPGAVPLSVKVTWENERQDDNG